MTITRSNNDKINSYENNKNNGLHTFGSGCDRIYNNIREMLHSNCCHKLINKLDVLEITTQYNKHVTDGDSYQLGIYLANFMFLIETTAYNNIAATGTITGNIKPGNDDLDHIEIGPVTDLLEKLIAIKEYIEKNKNVQAVYIPTDNPTDNQNEQENELRSNINNIITKIENIKVNEKNVEVHRVETLTDALKKLNITPYTMSSEDKSLTKNWFYRIKNYLSNIELIRLLAMVTSIAITLLIFISMNYKNKSVLTPPKPPSNQSHDKNKELLEPAIKKLIGGCYKTQQGYYSRAIDDLDEALFLFLYLDFKKVPEADGYIALADYFLKQSYNHAKDSDMFKATEEAFKSQLNKLSPQEEEKIKSNFKKNADCNKINNFFKNPHDM